jgi:hypothetical protein
VNTEDDADACEFKARGGESRNAERTQIVWEGIAV